MTANTSDANVEKVIEALNTAREMEMQAIHQYMVQHYIMDGLDYGKLCALLKLIAIDEMRHAEMLAERIEALGGKASCGSAGPVTQPQTVQEIYPFDVNMEANTVATYDRLAADCRKYGDPVTAGLFEKINGEENIHLAYYEETAAHIKNLGDAFLAKYAATSKHTGPIKSFVRLQQKEDD